MINSIKKYGYNCIKYLIYLIIFLLILYIIIFYMSDYKKYK